MTFPLLGIENKVSGDRDYDLARALETALAPKI
jgi:hypothetical protein